MKDKLLNIAPKGASWRKWDLHFHAPSDYTCAKNDQYEGESLEAKQNKFVEELKLVTDVSVLGITDYFSLDGYKMVLSKIDDLSHFDLILPNIELRITPVTGSNKKINLHIIPNTQLLDIDDIERFLYKFEFGAEKYTCSRKDLIKLGKSLSQNEISDEAAFKKGLNEYTISYDKFFEEYNKLPDTLKENILIGVSNNSGDGASGIKDLQGIRTILYSGVHFIFSAQNSDRTYFSGKGVDSVNQIIDSYGKLMPCIHGSDYHGSKDGSSICVPDLNRFCWIKADTTFEGLKQVLIEPIERVFIGEEPAIFKKVHNNQTKYIKHLSINKTPEYANQFGKWFENVNIEFNSELVAIIGNKGSGKSAIADILALCGNFNKPDSFSFLNKNKFRKGSLAKNFLGKITWESDVESQIHLNENPDTDELPRVKYLPQGDFEDLTNEIDKAKAFQEEIENVVFSHLEDEDKLSFRNFSELIENKKSIADKEIKSIQDDLQIIINSLIKLENKKNPNYVASIQGRLKQKKEELAALEKPKEVKDPNSDNLLSGLNKETLEKIEKIKIQIEELTNLISSKKDTKQNLLVEKSELDNFVQDIRLKEQEIAHFQSDYKDLSEKYSLKIESIIKVDFDYKVLDKLIKSKKDDIDKIQKEISGDQQNPENSLEGKLAKANDQLNQEQKKLDSTQKQYQDYLKDLKQFEVKKAEIEGDTDKPNTLKYFEKELHYIDFEIENDIQFKRAEILNYSERIFSIKETIVEIYRKVKLKIDEKIDENKSLLEDYNINIDASIVIKENFKDKFMNFISKQKKGSFHGKETGLVQLIKALEDCDASKVEDIKGFIRKIIQLLNNDNREGQNNEIRFVDDQIVELDEFYSYLYSLQYLDYNYRLKLGEKNLEQLSPGERGALLLVFYLLLDNNDIPLILDQPEDNLDNHSVANVLVPFIRRAKQKRQIILVTHNPNLAVVADAEQIIWVDIDKKEKNKFQYISGSIENREVNTRIVNVLEGAMPAFNKRKQKYYE